MTENPAPQERAPWGREGPVATPPPQPQPPASSTHPNRRKAEQSAAGAAWTALGPCRVTLATRPQFPHPESEARPAWPPPPGLWAQDSRPPPPKFQGNYGPLPTRLPRVAPLPPVSAHAGYLRSARRTLPPPETWRLRGPGRAPALRGPRLPPARPRRLPRSSRASLTQRSDTPKSPHETQPSLQGYRQAGPRLPASLTARASTSGCSAPRAPDPRDPWRISLRTVSSYVNEYTYMCRRFGILLHPFSNLPRWEEAGRG